MIAWTGLLIAGISLLAQVVVAALGLLACQAAAGHALQATRLADGTPDAGNVAARNVIAQVGGSVLRDPRVRVTRDGQDSAVTVTATALAVVPGIAIPLTATATGPTEPVLERP